MLSENGLYYIFNVRIYSRHRFSLFHDNPDTWELGITPVREQDTGVYVCQVSVHPPISFTVTLRVTGELCKIRELCKTGELCKTVIS